MEQKNFFIDIRDLLDMLKKSLWIIVLCVVIFAGLAWLVVDKTTYYVATAQMMIREEIVDTDTGRILEASPQQKALNIPTDSVIIRSDTVLETVIQNLDIDMTPEQLRGMVSVDSDEETAVMLVSVTSTEKAQAVEICNEIAKVCPAEIVALTGIQGVELIQSAVAVPFTPDAAVKRMLLIGAFTGLLFSIAFVLIRYFLDGTIRSEFEVCMDLKLPVLGILPRTKSENAHASEPVPPEHMETYNTLRTRFSRSGKHVIVVTAPGACGAKSMVAEKLAKALAVGEQRVLLIDGDLREGVLSNAMGFLKESKGLSHLLINTEEAHDGVLKHMENIVMLPAGNLPKEPARLLSTEVLPELLERLRQDYKYIVVDTPGVTEITDATIWGCYADTTVLVLDQAKTKMADAYKCKKLFEELGVEVWGAILNEGRN